MALAVHLSSRRAPRRSQFAAVALATLTVAVAVGVASREARADVEFKFGGQISSDIRYRFANPWYDSKSQEIDGSFPSQYKLLPYGFSRNENLIKAQASMRVSKKIKAVADVDLYVYGYSDLHNLDELTLHEKSDPYRFEINAAYLDIYKLLPGLDLRLTGERATALAREIRFVFT